MALSGCKGSFALSFVASVSVGAVSFGTSLVDSSGSALVDSFGTALVASFGAALGMLSFYLARLFFQRLSVLFFCF